MNIVVKPGKYVVAVSGGVDSVVLLRLVSCLPGLDLVVAHFDHGIRADSAGDAAFVRELAANYGLPFVSERAELGRTASELTARQARYNFLRTARQNANARAIILAHHQDDVLETTIHNLLRGTGRRGLSSLRSTDELLRPLLSVPKQALMDYALQQKLSWREDSTNYDERYTRNYIRHRLLVRFDADARQQLLTLIDAAARRNDELDAGLMALLDDHSDANGLQRRWFCGLPYELAKECLALWLRQCGVADYDRRTLERLTASCQTKAPGVQLDVLHGRTLVLGAQTISFTR